MGCNSSDIYTEENDVNYALKYEQTIVNRKKTFTIICEESKSTIISVVNNKNGHNEIPSKNSFNLKLFIK